MIVSSKNLMKSWVVGWRGFVRIVPYSINARHKPMSQVLWLGGGENSGGSGLHGEYHFYSAVVHG